MSGYPDAAALYPLPVRQDPALSSASFRPRLATTPLPRLTVPILTARKGLSPSRTTSCLAYRRPALLTSVGLFAYLDGKTLESLRERKAPYLSALIPVYNEEENLAMLGEEVSSALNMLGKPYEVILVDDGSKDRSFECLLNLVKNTPASRPCAWGATPGQTAAMLAGIHHASGELIVCLDADMQNDARDIPEADREARRGLRLRQRLAQGPAGPLSRPQGFRRLSPMGLSRW